MVRDYEALHRYLAERSRTPFGGFAEWESCARFAAGAVAAQTGDDPLGRVTAWSTELEAAAVLARAGSFVRAVSGALSPCPIGLAQRGDVGLIPGDTPAGGVLVVVEGAHLIGPDASGVRRVQRSLMTHAWRAA